MKARRSIVDASAFIFPACRSCRSQNAAFASESFSRNQRRRRSSYAVNEHGLVTRKQHTSGNHSYQVIVGLEIHAQIDIPTKLFSSAPSMTRNPLAAAPNSKLHPFDTAVPGFLPRLSKSAVQKAVLAAAALNCNISRVSRFERKHYTYADLPHSYQITQQRWPLATQGILQGADFECGIERIQLESDTAKTLTSASSTQSLIDYNRAGCALLEIVTTPGLRSSQQAVAAVAQIRQLLLHANVCQGRMQLGHLRVDVNVNLQRLRDGQRNARVEVKNLNSVQQVRHAIDYEATRQAELWETLAPDNVGAEETRTWDVVKAQTVLMRTKNAADDYRFLPEPDLPPLIMNESTFDGMSLEAFVAQNLPELPSTAVDRLQRNYGISDQTARVLASDPPAIRLLDEAMKLAPDETRRKHEFGKVVTNLLVNELFALVKQQAAAAAPDADSEDEAEASLANCHISGAQLGELALMQYEGTVSSTMAKKVLSIMHQEQYSGSSSPRDVAAQHGLQLLSDPAKLLALCHEAIAQHPEQLDLYRQGGKFVHKMKKLFSGKVMAASRGNAHPERLQEALKQALEDAAASDSSNSKDQNS